jgi:uncharacterized protein (DUF58 family)
MWRTTYWLLSRITGAFFWYNRRISPAGRVATGTLLVAGAFGIDTTQSLSYQIFTFVLAAMASALVAARFLKPRFEARRELPRVVTAGQSFSYPVTVRNLGPRAADGLTLFEEIADPRPSFEQFRARLKFPSYRGWWRLVMQSQPARLAPSALPPVGPGAKAVVRVNGFAHRRGTLALQATAVAQAEPLGLARAVFRAPQPDKVVVLPRRYSLPDVALPGSRRYQQGGVANAAAVGESGEFMGLREYRPGDPLQRIHWKSFARLGEPVVREFEGEFFERHALILDTFPVEQREDAFEEAVSIAASFACSLETRDSLLDLLFVGAQSWCYTAGRGQLQPGQLVEILAGVQPCIDKPFQSLVDNVMARRATISGCILILLGWDQTRREFAQRLRASAIPVLTLVVSAQDAGELPAGTHRLVPGRIQEGLAAL